MNTSATTNTNNKINISNNNAINDKNNTSYPSSAMLSPAPRRGTKRKITPAIRKRRKLQNTSKSGESRLEQVPQTKNTVAVLNELKRNLVYKVESQTGPVHAPLFTISVVVDGQKFVGTGPSKKLARVAAAASALRSFIQFKDGATLTPIEPLQNVDFTSDDPMIENSIFPLNANSKSVSVLPTNGNNWQRKEAIATGSVHSTADNEKQPAVEKASAALPPPAAAISASAHSVRTAPAAASS
uniref:DRBM domain-containing protein n=1 Tax=Anopheles maculatus TaxID=74869 RepID=A0A182T3N1_9DIPT